MQNAAASFVKFHYSKVQDVIDLRWLPVKERTEFSLVKLAWKSINSRDWPKYLPMEIQQPSRPTRNSKNNGVRCYEC